MGRTPINRCFGLAVMLLTGPGFVATAQTVVVDNTDPGFAVLSQAWSTANVAGQYGEDYRYRSTSLTPGLVEWRPDLPATGTYEVAVWYRSSGTGRPDNARYTVQHAGGAEDVLVNQQLNGSEWVRLGTFPFDAGTGGAVTLTSDAEPAKTIVADAVRWTPQFGSGRVPELRACWLTHYYFLGKTEAQLRAAAQNMRAGHINTVYIAAYSGATTYWPSRAYQAAGGNWSVSSFDLLAWLVDIFRDEGLKVGAWFEYGMALGPASHPIAQAHPDWLARDATGDAVTGENGGFVFLSPGHPEAMNLLADMVRELAENYAFDDIQIDRFRWGRKEIGEGREYGYENATADRYRAAYGNDPPQNVNHPQWVAFREGLVNDAVQACYNVVKQANPHIIVSSAPTGSYGITQHMQRWSDWVEGGYMDLVMPQMYKTSLSAFVSEFDTQVAQAPGRLDKLAVGYRAQDDDDHTLVADQMAYARDNGIDDGCLWVYHQYTAQVAIQDEIDHLPDSGAPWAEAAYNPFVSDRMVQVIIDDDQGTPAYQETGAWIDSAQPDRLKFGSRVADGAAPATATFHASIPRAGRYDVYVWYTAAGNRNPHAQYHVHHYNGVAEVIVDQRSGGGQWVRLGDWVFDADALSPRVTVANADGESGTYTSNDGAKLVLTGYALGDADGDGDVDAADLALADGCYLGPIASAPAGCAAFDIDDDDDIDLRDYALLQQRP